MNWHAMGRYAAPGGERVALILDSGVYDAAATAETLGMAATAASPLRGVAGLLADWPASAAALAGLAARAAEAAARGTIKPLTGARLLAPCQPQRIFAAASNYQEHAKEMGFSGREPPFFFMKPADAVVPVDAHDADLDAAACLHALDEAFYSADGRQPEHQARVIEWLRRYRHCLRKQGIAGSARNERMRGANPKYVPRNYLAQLAIDAAERGDTSVLERLLRVLRRPYDDQPEAEDLAARRPEWARHRVGCSALSCSS